MDLEPSLPDDVLAGVLRRLAPRCLAASRCVCKTWCRVVDTHRLLRADLLPLSLGGIFFNCLDMRDTQFLSRPTTGATVSGGLFYTVPRDFDGIPSIDVSDHCNGLLLLDHCVVNPATRQWALLPQNPEPHPSWGREDVFTSKYLAFDPTLSPHFELLIMPHFPVNLNECDGSEWPPSTLILPVFSSKTGSSWEDRAFFRNRVIATTLPGMFGPVRLERHQCGYWRGALYIGYSEYFVMRISLSDNTYQVIRLLAEDGEPREDDQDDLYLGKSDKGIYCASVFQSVHLQVWFLNDQTEWVLKHHRDISPILPNLDKYSIQRHGPWILQEFNYWNLYVQLSDDDDFDDEDSAEEDSSEAVVDEKFDWDSDNDNVLEPGSIIEYCRLSFLGFHPLKEVVFFMSSSFDRMLAYNWSTSKLQDFGKVFPKFYTDIGRRGFYHIAMVTQSFPYTPCWLGELPEKLNLEAQLED